MSLLVLADETPRLSENPAATRLLAEARLARSNMLNFPGFTADIHVTMNDKTYQGSVQVDAKGKVIIADMDNPQAGWAKRVLASAVSHRLQQPHTMKTPCAFAKDDDKHPLGRLIHVLNDELHSSYRIRDNQIMVVNRLQDGARFSITVQANIQNEEGKYLPSAYSVHYWDKDGTLEKAEAHTQTWKRQQGYDLPHIIRVTTVNKDIDCRELRLENIKLQ
ncbi:MAG TPA: DUF3386 family protein [Gemmatales bacterium]|nr:DUF3386 family protein [Gemmatales bacterium]